MSKLKDKVGSFVMKHMKKKKLNIGSNTLNASPVHFQQLTVEDYYASILSAE